MSNIRDLSRFMTPHEDLKPRVFYGKDGRALAVAEYCNVNNYTIAVGVYAFDSKNYAEQHFDEYHGIYDAQSRPCSKERLISMRGGLPLIEILGAEKSRIEAITEREHKQVVHVE